MSRGWKREGDGGMYKESRTNSDNFGALRSQILSSWLRGISSHSSNSELSSSLGIPKDRLNDRTTLAARGSEDD